MLSCGFAAIPSLLVIDDSPWTTLRTTDGHVGNSRVVHLRGDLWLDGPVGDPVARGLAGNPAAPADVLLCLLDDHAEAVPAAFRRRADLPPRSSQRRCVTPWPGYAAGEVVELAWRDRRAACGACRRHPPGAARTCRRIVDLLDDIELAESTARNPALPVDAMRERLASSAPSQGKR